METEGLNMTSSVMMEKLANLFMDVMTWNNVPTDASSSEWYSFHTHDERKYFFFSTLSVLFLLWQEASTSNLPLGFDSELITSCDAVICSLWCRLRWPNFHLGLLPAVFYQLSASKSLKQINSRALQLGWNLDLSAFLLKRFPCYLMSFRAVLTLMSLNPQLLLCNLKKT